MQEQEEQKEKKKISLTTVWSHLLTVLLLVGVWYNIRWCVSLTVTLLVVANFLSSYTLRKVAEALQQLAKDYYYGLK